MGYEEIQEAAEAYRAEKVAEREQLLERHAQELAAIDEEIAGVDRLIATAKELDPQTSGGASPPPGGGPPKPGPRRSSRPPANSSAGGRARPASKRPRDAGKYREECKAKLLEVMEKVDWIKPRTLIEQALEAGMSKSSYTRAIRDLVEEGTVETRGATVNLEYRAKPKAESRSSGIETPPPGRRTPPPAPPTPPPAKPKRQEVGHPLDAIASRIVDWVDRHDPSTTKEIAQGLGRGTKAGESEVAAALTLLSGRDQMVEESERWRLPSQPKLGGSWAPPIGS